jgi:hypothetical protein
VSDPDPAAASQGKSRWRLIFKLALLAATAGLALLILLALWALFTPSIHIARPSAARLLLLPDKPASYLGLNRIPEARATFAGAPWANLSDPDLLRKMAARTTLPGAATLEGSAAERLVPILLGMATDDCGVLGAGRNAQFVGRVGLRGRIAFNIARFFGRITGVMRGARVGTTPGLMFLSRQSQAPVFYLAMRGSYVFAAQNEETLVRALSLADGRADAGARSVDAALTLAIGEGPRPHVIHAALDGSAPPRVFSATIERARVKFDYRYPLAAPLPTAPAAGLIATARALPKDTAVFTAAVWPTAVVASHSPSALRLRSSLEEALRALPGAPLKVLDSELKRPVALAASDWIQIAGYPPLPKLTIVAPAKNDVVAMNAGDALLRGLLKSAFARGVVSEDGVNRVVYRHPALGEFAPTLAARGQNVFFAANEATLKQDLAAAAGLIPCLADRAEMNDLIQFTAREPVAAVALVPGTELARLGTDLLLALSTKLSPTAAADVRDLLVPVARRFTSTRALVARLIVEQDGRTGRWQAELLPLEGKR